MWWLLLIVSLRRQNDGILTIIILEAKREKYKMFDQPKARSNKVVDQTFTSS